MWSLSGQYIQTIGTFKEWRPIMSLKPISVKHMKAIIPADLDRKISSTTLRVLMGGYIEKVPVIKGQMVPVGRTSFIIDRSKVYGETVTQPVLGNFYDIPKRVTRTGAIEFDTTFSYVKGRFRALAGSSIKFRCFRYRFISISIYLNWKLRKNQKRSLCQQRVRLIRNDNRTCTCTCIYTEYRV